MLWRGGESTGAKSERSEGWRLKRGQSCTAPLGCACSSVDRAADFESVRAGVRVLPGALSAHQSEIPVPSSSWKNSAHSGSSRIPASYEISSTCTGCKEKGGPRLRADQLDTINWGQHDPKTGNISSPPSLARKPCHDRCQPAASDSHGACSPPTTAEEPWGAVP